MKKLATTDWSGPATSKSSLGGLGEKIAEMKIGESIVLGFIKNKKLTSITLKRIKN